MPCGDSGIVTCGDEAWRVKTKYADNTCDLVRKKTGHPAESLRDVDCTTCKIGHAAQFSMNTLVTVAETGVTGKITKTYDNGNFKVLLDSGAIIASVGPEQFEV